MARLALPFSVVCLLLLAPEAHAQSCAEKLAHLTGAYVYSHSVPIGNGTYECYSRATDGSSAPIKDTIAFDPDPVETPGAPTEAPACPSGTYLNKVGERII